jgi:hypothetical protein
MEWGSKDNRQQQTTCWLAPQKTYLIIKFCLLQPLGIQQKKVCEIMVQKKKKFPVEE